MPGRRLTFEERQFIEVARRSRLSAREIGRELGRPHTTICREVERNRQTNGAYRCVVAQFRAGQRAKRPKVFKLARQRWLAGEVERRLRRGWSPEQIAQGLRRAHPDDPRWWVSPEAIYGSLYVQGRGGLKAELIAHLKSKRSARKHGLGPGRLPDTVHISQRPAEARDRAVPGHWEGDLLLGARSESQVGMLTERTTRFTVLLHLPTDRTAASVLAALVQEVQDLPAHLRRSLTWDNGKEMARHAEFKIATDVQVYFCDPGHPWQRGTAENTIGLLRAYLPRTENLSRYDRHQLHQIAVMLNERPRKTLNWRSPAEAYAELLTVQ